MKEIKVYELSDGTIERDLKKAQKKEILFKISEMIKSFGLGVDGDDGYQDVETSSLYEFFEYYKEDIPTLLKDLEMFGRE